VAREGYKCARACLNTEGMRTGLFIITAPAAIVGIVGYSLLMPHRRDKENHHPPSVQPEPRWTAAKRRRSEAEEDEDRMSPAHARLWRERERLSRDLEETRRAKEELLARFNVLAHESHARSLENEELLETNNDLREREMKDYLNSYRLEEKRNSLREKYVSFRQGLKDKEDFNINENPLLDMLDEYFDFPENHDFDKEPKVLFQ